MSDTENHCPCYALREQPLDPAWPAPRCPGILRPYPSGNRACDCGEHVLAAVRR